MRVGIVNDLGVAREALRRVILSEPGHSVAWMACDGEEAVARARQDTPDVILMDLVMPVLDGIEATRRIMTTCPCPILVVTSDVTGRFGPIAQAMGFGALDVVATPHLSSNGQLAGSAELLARLARLAQTQSADRRGSSREERAPKEKGTSGSSSHFALRSPEAALPPLIALGASTGGPEALAQVLSGLPDDLSSRVGVLVVQHISADFATSLATWLRGRTGKSVRPAEEGDVPRAGEVLVAATEDHLVLRRGGTLGYTREPLSCPWRPSVDVLFNSLAERWTQPGVAVLMTGMGSDGAAGLAALRQKGWYTIAQDRATSVVYGMPRAAAERNAACAILPLPEIAGGVGCGLRKLSVRADR